MFNETFVTDDKMLFKKYSIRVADSRNLPKKTGKGKVFGHHGEILQGKFFVSGSIYRGLATQPCNVYFSTAEFTPRAALGIDVYPCWKTKSKNACELLLIQMGLHEKIGGVLKIETNIPPCLGNGSSTADIVAAIKAVCNAFDFVLTDDEIARITVMAEKASDSIMYDRPVLFAHRRGFVLEELGNTLPPVDVLGFNTDPSGNGIETLSLPPADYNWKEIESFKPLVGLLRRSVFLGDPELLGIVATASARINEKFLPKLGFKDIERIATLTGAVGIQVAHSGSVVGIMYDGRRSQEVRDRKTSAAMKAVRSLGFKNICRFSTINAGGMLYEN